MLSGCKTMQQEKAQPLTVNQELTQQLSSESTNVQPPDASIELEKATVTDSESALVDEPPKTEPPVVLEPVLPAEPAPITDVWQRVSDGLVIPVPEHSRLVSQRRWYAKHQKYLDRVVERARPFLFFIVEEIEKRNLPMELALLPIVESAFDPFAYSHGRASGMWQFIPGTAKRYGMKQNWWYDGRRDIYASTQGALDYLTYLHRHFKGNWLHALAAYNSGEGNVGRAIRNNKRRGKPIDFWNLRLPKETKAYVPKLLALADLLKRNTELGINWTPIKNEMVIERVNIGSQLDLALAAELAGMSVEDIYKLNPGFNRWSTPPKGPHFLIIPVDKSAAFKTQLAETDNKDRVRWLRYTIKNGDSLSTIASKHNTTVAILRSVNNINGTGIRAGKPLLIPTASRAINSYTLSSDKRLNSKLNRKRAGLKIQHKVQPGDSFWKIARKYNVGHRALAKWNGMAPTDPLKVGKDLVVWTKSSKVAPSQSSLINQKQRLRKIHYRVRRGDSLARISSKFAVTVKDLKRWNNYLSGKKYLQPGDKITLYVDITNQSGGN